LVYVLTDDKAGGVLRIEPATEVATTAAGGR
jgi:hypothetical protein